jgi:hypothetical protein
MALVLVLALSISGPA